MSLTSNLNYAPKSGSVQARSYRTTVTSNNSTYTGGQTMQFDIPTGRPHTYLDQSQSFLKFSVVITNGGTQQHIYTDNSAYSFLNQMNIWHGGQLIEQIANHNVLAPLLLDFQASFTASASWMSATMGTSLTMTASNAEGGNRAGFDFGNPTANASTTIVTFCLPIISGFIGMMADKYVPLGEMSGDIRLEYILENVTKAVVAANAVTSYTLSVCELDLCFIEITPEASNQVRELNGGIYQIHGSSFRNYTSTATNTAGVQTFVIPAKFASLKSLLVSQRSAANITSQAAYSLCNRLNLLSTAQLRLNSNTYPNKPIDCISVSEPYCELLKSFHAWGIANHATGVNLSLYSTSVFATVDSSQAFALGFELESFAHKTDILESGVNTLSSNLYLDLNYTAAPGGNLTVDSFAWYDHMIIIQNGLASVKM